MTSLDILPQGVRKVLELYRDRVVDKYHPLGILLVGSYSKGYESDNSDIDIYVIVQEQDWRERGNTWINGYEVEYFINPVKQIRSYFRNENRVIPHSADMVANGLIIYQRDPVVDELIEEAKQILEEQQPLEGVELELLRYTLDDLRKDILDLSPEPVSFAYQRTLWGAIEQCNLAIFRHYSTYAKRSKVRMQQLKKLDVKYSEILQNVIENPQVPNCIFNLIEYVESLIGSRPEEWSLRGQLDL